MSLRSSRRVTQTHSQLTISTKMKAKKTRFLSPSPPQPEGAYEAFRACWAAKAGEVVQALLPVASVR